MGTTPSKTRRATDTTVVRASGTTTSPEVVRVTNIERVTTRERIQVVEHVTAGKVTRRASRPA